MEYIVPPNQMGIRCNNPPPLGCPIDICPLDGCGVYSCGVFGCGTDSCAVDGCGARCSGRQGQCSVKGQCPVDCTPGVN